MVKNSIETVLDMIFLRQSICLVRQLLGILPVFALHHPCYVDLVRNLLLCQGQSLFLGHVQAVAIHILQKHIDLVANCSHVVKALEIYCYIISSKHSI
jgi:hypothetical protein